MDLQKYKVVLVTIILIVALFVSSSALEMILAYPSAQSASFTELWLLGPEHKAENYPYDITLNENYSVYLGIADQLGYYAYYQVEVKFCNLTQQAPNTLNDSSSSQPSLYNMSLCVPNDQSLEIPITFSFNYTYDPFSAQINFNQLTFNGLPLDLEGYSTTWNSQRSAFYGILFFELWIYNSTTGTFQYNDRYVSIQLNMTETEE